MRHTIIYIPGLIDRLPFLIWVQRQLFKSWRVFGNRVEIFRIGWTGDVDFNERAKELEKRITELRAQGAPVSLIGASAGASAALNVYAKLPKEISGVVCICGALQGMETLPEAAFKLNPRFKESIERLPASLDKLDDSLRQRVMTLRPLVDGVVLPKNAVLEGARNKRIISFGHLFSIGYFVYGRNVLIWRFLRKRARVQ